MEMNAKHHRFSMITSTLHQRRGNPLLYPPISVTVQEGWVGSRFSNLLCHVITLIKYHNYKTAWNYIKYPGCLLYIAK